jgi:hypothetical protein
MYVSLFVGVYVYGRIYVHVHIYKYKCLNMYTNILDSPIMGTVKKGSMRNNQYVINFRIYIPDGHHNIYIYKYVFIYI